MTTNSISLPVEGMSCASCVAKIEGAIGKVDGVEKVGVNLATEKAKVTFSDGQVDLNQVVDAVADVGYRIPAETMMLPIGGMSCASCVTTIEGALAAVPGVVSATVNLATEKARVAYGPGVASLQEFKKAVSDVGYEVLISSEGSVPEDQEDQTERKMRQATFRMRVAWAFTIPIILWMFAEMFFGIIWPNEVIFNLGMILLALPVLFWVGRDTYRGDWPLSGTASPIWIP